MAKPAVRLNGTSDIQWEVAHFASRGELRGCVFELFPEVQFYDYTKVYKRAYRALPANYRLVLSYSMANERYADAILKTASETGANVAVVFGTRAQRDELASRPETFLGAGLGMASIVRQVIDGDSDDMRFLDPAGVIVGLYAKGAAKRDTSGFVLH